MIVQTNCGKKLTGIFRGQVVKHLLHGKCKIWIPGVYPEEFKTQPDKLPDAEQASPIFSGGNFGNGTFSYPNIGATVVCMFWNEDQNYPLYFATTLGGPYGARGFEHTHQGELDEKTGRKYPYIHEINAGKTNIKLFDGGQVMITTNGDKGKNSIKINNDGTMEINSDSQIQVNSGNMKICTDKFQLFAKSINMSSVDQTNIFSENISITSRENTVVTTKRTPTGKTL